MQTLARPAFSDLPLLVEGDSKEVRLLNSAVCLERLKPTVYSYTENRYGIAPGTDIVRAKFTAAVFRYLRALDQAEGLPDGSAFIDLIETEDGPLLMQRRVVTCNLEVRVKRFHIGSPIHRYLYTEQHESTQLGGPIHRWSRFDQPLVCFDWRHPLVGDEGQRLADEPISDDYAGVWMENIPNAKALACRTFARLEELFSAAGLVLIDICLFISRDGRTLYGEISPDCMRIRRAGIAPQDAESFDKDLWRDGSSPQSLLDSYDRIYRELFPQWRN